MENNDLDFKALASVFLVKFYTKSQMKDWIYTFFGLSFPDSFVDPESSSSPIEWMWDVYQMYRDNKCNESPSVITISSRESYKTLSQSAMSVILMTHFNATICHMAAIVPQASAAQNYVANFLRMIDPYMRYHKKEVTSQNAKEVKIKDDNGSEAWMKIVVCSISGANSSHSNILCLDEIDTIRGGEGIRAYKEASFIPGVFNGQFPVTIKTSTLKFPGGLFSKEIEMSRKENWKTFKWNIIDITEKCQPERFRPDLPKEDRYVRYELPLSSLTEVQYNNLLVKEKEAYTKINVHAGCSNCPILPVCRERLAHRSEEDVGGLWKPIDFTITQFKKSDPDLAEAQLLTRKPSSQGMVYPRFVHKEDGTGNTYTTEQAWASFTGEIPSGRVEFDDLINKLQEHGIKIYAGADWGTTHCYALGISAIMPNGDWWILDGYAVPGFEFSQQLSLAIELRDRYGIKKWFCDTSSPSSIKTFNKNKMPCAEFKKDVQAGINAVRTQIVDASGKRRLKVIRTDRNELYLKMFAEHTFKLDQLGNITKEPDDGEFADIADQLRYQAQNLFQAKGKNNLISTEPTPLTREEIHKKLQDDVKKGYAGWVTTEIQKHVEEPKKAEDVSVSKNGSIIWDID